MEERWWDGKRALRMAGVWTAWGGVCWVLGLVFAVLGIIGEAADVNVGLLPMSWFLLSIAALVASIPEYLGWAVAVLVDAIEAKSKKAE